MSVAPEPDFSDRLDFAVDSDAEPADVDEVLAEFLLTLVREEGLAE